MEAANKDKDRWYPGKYLKSKSRRSVEVSRGSVDEGESSSRKSMGGALLNPATDLKEQSQETFSGEVHFNPAPTGEDSVGSIKVSLVDIKYLRISSAKLSIQLDRVSSQYAVDASSKGFERSFELHDISSDIRISVIGKGDGGELVCGVVIIPIVTLLNFTGKPVPAKEQWRQLFPVCVSRISDNKPFKFTAGYSDFPGYALNRSKDPLGYVCVKVDLTLAGSMASTYLAKGGTGWKKVLACVPWADAEPAPSDSSVRSNAELCAMINRDMARILAIFRLPLSLTSVFSLPEVLVVNVLLGCMCFVLDSWQLPAALVGFCLLNGLIALSQRSYAGVTVWNDPLPLTLVGTPADPNHSSNLPQNMDPLLFLAGSVPTSVTAYPAAAAAATALMAQQALDLAAGDGEPSPAQRGTSVGSGSLSADGDGAVRDKPTALRLLQQQNVALARIARNLSLTAHVLEVACNLLSFADSRASLLAYGALLALACLTSLGLLIWPRTCAFFMVTGTTLACAAGAYVLDMVEAKAGNKRSIGSAPMEKASDALDCLASLLNRVPDELELIHRYIASTAIMNPKGSEMQDAALVFEKRVQK